MAQVRSNGKFSCLVAEEDIFAFDDSEKNLCVFRFPGSCARISVALSSIDVSPRFPVGSPVSPGCPAISPLLTSIFSGCDFVEYRPWRV